MNKFKEWLWKTDDEGISNFDVITMATIMIVVYGLIIAHAALA